MKIETGWADPEVVVGAPRIQMVAGFTYFFAEEKHIMENLVGRSLDRVVAIVRAGFQRIFPRVDQPSLLVMFIDDPVEDGIYDVRAGFAVSHGTQPVDGVFVEDQQPALVASILYCGPIGMIHKSYSPLMEYMNQNALKCVVGWREWYLYYENHESSNNVLWVQHLAERQSTAIGQSVA